MEDGLLTMKEILGLELDADWVILSACNAADRRWDLVDGPGFRNAEGKVGICLSAPAALGAYPIIDDTNAKR
jgi:hypothetical protein